jgi:hypothetical protein
LENFQAKTVPLLPLEMEAVCSAEIIVTDYQNQYFCTGNFLTFFVASIEEGRAASKSPHYKFGYFFLFNSK